MDTLKKIFPLSFKNTDSVANLVIGILIYLVGDIIAGAIIGLLAKLPLIGIVFGLIGSLVGLYCLAGIVILVLVYLKVLK
ncbi:MAG: hypothetical protein J6Q53_01735 [Oscillospiraceae bacterium]|nr:hypothetical protein [Oscillospiraceae bacterium]